MYIIIILVVLVILLGLNFMRTQEGFITSTEFRHAKLNDFGGVDYVDRMPPPWRGENGCFRYPCPETFDKNIACWYCPWIYYDAQNE